MERKEWREGKRREGGKAGTREGKEINMQELLHNSKWLLMTRLEQFPWAGGRET